MTGTQEGWKTQGKVAVTNYVYFNPVTTVLSAWLVLSERITLYFIIGTILILVGMYLSNSNKQKNHDSLKISSDLFDFLLNNDYFCCITNR